MKESSPPVARIGHDVLHHEAANGSSRHRHALGHGGVERNDRRAVANDVEPCRAGGRREELPLEVRAVPRHVGLDEVDEREQPACVVGLGAPHRYVGTGHRASWRHLRIPYGWAPRATCGVASRGREADVADVRPLDALAARARVTPPYSTGARRERIHTQWPLDDLIRSALASASGDIRTTAARLSGPVCGRTPCSGATSRARQSHRIPVAACPDKRRPRCAK